MKKKIKELFKHGWVGIIVDRYVVLLRERDIPRLILSLLYAMSTMRIMCNINDS